MNVRLPGQGRAIQRGGGSAPPPVLWLVAAALLLSLMLLIIIFMVPFWTTQKLPPEVQLAAVIVLGVSIVMNLLFIMTAGYQRMQLTSSNQALGLPAGSIRALIALFLILMFAIIGIYVFNAVLGAGASISQQALSLAQQLMTTIATLVVAVAGFYFGTASTARGAQIANDAARVARGENTVQISTTSPLPDAPLNNSYTVQFEGAGGKPPYKWAIMASPGPWPPGLTLNTATGVLEGKPTASGDYRFTIQVIDAAKATDLEEFRLQVADGATAPGPAAVPAPAAPTGPTNTGPPAP